MSSTPADLMEPSELTPVPAALAAQADALVKAFPECFWFWHSQAHTQNLEDVRLVVEHLREYGDRRAWWAAQELHQCHLQHSKKTS